MVCCSLRKIIILVIGYCSRVIGQADARRPHRQIENRELAPINPWLVTGIVLAILLPLEELAGLGLIAAVGSALLKSKRKLSQMPRKSATRD